MVYRPVLLPSVSTSMVYLSICSYVCLFASLLVHCEVAYRSIGCVAKNLLNIKADIQRDGAEQAKQAKATTTAKAKGGGAQGDETIPLD